MYFAFCVGILYIIYVINIIEGKTEVVDYMLSAF